MTNPDRAPITSRRPRSLVQTLAVAFLALSAISLLANGVITLYTNATRQRSDIAAQQQVIAQGASREISRFFEDKFKALEAATEIIELPRGTVEQRTLILQSLLATQPAFRQMILLDASGQAAAQTSRVSLELSAQFRSQLQGTLSGQEGQSDRLIGNLYYDDVTNEPLIVLAIPVTIWDFDGVLAAEVNLQFMWTLVDELRVGRTGYVYIVDNEGNLIASRDTARVLAGENVAQISEVNEFVANPAAPAAINPEFASYTGLSGTRVVGTHVPLGYPQWAVLTELPSREAFEPVYQAVATSVAAILVMGILAGLAGVFVARRLTVPLVNLTGTATRIANGEIHLQARADETLETSSLAAAFNAMTSQLEELIASLEQRVEERTRELKGRTDQQRAIAELARSITSYQGTDELLPAITRLVSERLGFYHVGIFLLDSENEFALLRAANSAGGARMLARGHRLRVGQQGIVGYVTSQGIARIALDVGEEASYFNNPDLPETHSEVALPLKFGREVIGALDIQSTKINAFTQEDVDVLSILADQVSIAIQNARSLEQAQRAVREAESASSQLTGRAWRAYSESIRAKGYRYDGMKPEPLKNETRPAREQDSVVVPVELRGQMLGRLKIKASDSSRKWTEDELAIIESTAERVALAMDGARLLDDAQKRAARETFLSELAAKLGTSFQLDSILRDTVEELGQALKGSTVTFQLVDPSAPPPGKDAEDGAVPKKRTE